MDCKGGNRKDCRQELTKSHNKKRDIKANQKLAEALINAPCYNFSGSPMIKLLSEIEKNEKLTPEFVDTFITMCIKSKESIDNGDIYSITNIPKILSQLDTFCIEHYLIPIHNAKSKHWSLCCIQKDGKKVYHFDSLSLKTSNEIVKERINHFENTLISLGNYPRQENTFDGGVYMLCIYYHLSTAEDVSELLSPDFAFESKFEGQFSRDFLKDIINQKLNDKIINRLCNLGIALSDDQSSIELSENVDTLNNSQFPKGDVRMDEKNCCEIEQEDNRETKNISDLKNEESEPAPPRVVVKKEHHTYNNEKFYYKSNVQKQPERVFKSTDNNERLRSQIKKTFEKDSSSKDICISTSIKLSKQQSSTSLLKDKVISSQAAYSTQRVTSQAKESSPQNLNSSNNLSEFDKENISMNKPEALRFKTSQEPETLALSDLKKAAERPLITNNSAREERAEYQGRAAYFRRRHFWR
ncbi:unnamed protein product [Moneuplotes crassus]|uniref:Ubiquitin-like protease family profile domain-containing protein n=1 Tax=Euplotes crassus TaxID=5936 RepID=A0AAD1XAA5_EUPCR|nr:unnamed protein product [Moneuplotes crassus]